MVHRTRNLLGSDGYWTADGQEDRPKILSFLNPRWSGIEEWRKEALRKVAELISAPRIKKPVVTRSLKRYRFDGLDIEELSWSLPYGQETEAVFLKPQQSKGKLPAILALHDHGEIKYFGKRKIIRTSEEVHSHVLSHQNEYYGGVAWANELAKRGYGILIHDVFPFESRRILASNLPSPAVRRMMRAPLEVEEVKTDDLKDDTPIKDYDVPSNEPASSIKLYNAFGIQHESVIAKSLFSSGITWPGVFLAEDICALDYLCSRPDVDSTRIGCCGLSGGGLRTNYLAGMDNRIRCLVTAGFMTTWRDFALSVGYAHTWMVYIPLLPKYMDFPEILGLRVPLPSLVISSKGDPLFSGSEVIRAGNLLERIYAKVGVAGAFRISYYEGAHRFDLSMQEEAFDWFDSWLKQSD